MNLKGLLAGILLLIVIGLAGFFYRNAVERPIAHGTCTADARICPDGSAVGRVAPDCNFAQCPSPNVTLPSANIIFDLPAGYSAIALPDSNSIAAYNALSASTTTSDELVIRSYPIGTSTPVAVMYASAIGDASGAPVSPSTFSAVTLGDFTYSMVVLGQYEGTVHVAYYLPMGSQLLRFDSIDQNITNWNDPGLSIATLPADSALRQMLSTLEANQ